MPYRTLRLQEKSDKKILLSTSKQLLSVEIISKKAGRGTTPTGRGWNKVDSELEVESEHELQNAPAGFDCTRDVAVGAAHLPECGADVVVVGSARAGAEVGQVE